MERLIERKSRVAGGFNAGVWRRTGRRRWTGRRLGLTQGYGGAKGIGVLLTSIDGVAILVGDVKVVEQR